VVTGSSEIIFLKDFHAILNFMWALGLHIIIFM
jgi:hypothetical protein